MKSKHQPKTGWNDLDAQEAGGPTRLQADQNESAALKEATKELSEKIGMGGSLGQVNAGGVVVGPGLGVSAYEGGIKKSAIEPDGDVFFGSDISTPEGMSFAVFVNEQFYNAELMGEGDILIGDNSPQTSNVKYDASEGQLQFRFGTTVQVYMDTDGSISFGAGTGELNSDGIQLIAEGLLQNDNGYKFVDVSGDNAGGVYAIKLANSTFVTLRAHGQNGDYYQYASVDAVASGLATARLTADSALNAGAAASLSVIQDATGRAVFENITNVEIPTGATYDINGTPHTHSALNGSAVLGGTFSITAAVGTFEDTGLSVTLPAAGTYRITADVRAVVNGNTGTNWLIVAELYNSTDAAAVADSERLLINTDAAATSIRGTASINKIVTVTASKTIKLYVKRDGVGPPTFTTSNIPSDGNGKTVLMYEKIG